MTPEEWRLRQEAPTLPPPRLSQTSEIETDQDHAKQSGVHLRKSRITSESVTADLKKDPRFEDE